MVDILIIPILVIIGVIYLYYPSIIIKANVRWIKLFFGKDLYRIKYFNSNNKIVEIIKIAEEDPDKFWNYYPQGLGIMKLTGLVAILLALASICVRSASS